MLHFRHTRMLSSCTTPMTSQSIVSYFSNLKLFSTFTQYMSVSHGYSTMGGIEYNEGVMWRRHKGESLTSMRLINGLGRCPSIDVNARSRDCHATDALELQMYESSSKKKLSGCASNLLAHEDLGHLRKPIVGIYKPSSITKIPTSI